MNEIKSEAGISPVLSTAGLGCGRCHGTGVVRYKELDAFAFRQWVPWQEMACPNGCIPNPDKQSNAEVSGAGTASAGLPG